MPRPASLLLLAACWLPAVPPAAAAALDADSSLTAVTVYRNQASLQRSARLDLPAGASTVVFEPLPPGLREPTLRAEAGEGVRIGAVESETVFTTEFSAEREQALQAAIQDLEDRLAALDDRKRAAELELEFLRGLAQKGPGTGEAPAAAIEPKRWREAQAVIGEGSRDALSRIQAVAVERRPLQAELEKKQKELEQLRSGRKQHRRVSVRVETETARADARIALHYGVDQAGWTPDYAARLATEAGTLELVHKAEVRQNTGEDWTEVQLTLSTARPSTATEPPTLSPWFIDFAQVRPAQRRDKAMALMEQEAPRAGAAAEPAEAVGREYSAAWRVAGRSSVASTNQTHRFRLGSHALEVELSARAVPRLNPRAFLFAEGDFPGEAALPAGPLTLYLDGAFRGRSRLALLRPGEPLRLGYGTDDRLQVEFIDRGRLKDESGVFTKTKRHQRRYLFKVNNRHSRPLEVTLLDQLPVPRHEAITVELLEGSDAPEQRDVEDRPGILSWSRKVPAGEAWSVEFGYLVSYPADQHIPGFE